MSRSLRVVADLKWALLLAGGFVLVGLWFAMSLPGEALADDEVRWSCSGSSTSS
jgi:hypothetical protein